MNLWRVLRAWSTWRRERQQRAAQDGRGVRIVGEKPPRLRKAPGRLEIVQNAADVGPTGPNDRWLLDVAGETYHARYLRPRHVDGYNRRLATGRKESARFQRWFPDHPERANERLRSAERVALHYLLVQAFPTRPSYLIRGSPVKQVLAQPMSEQAVALVALLQHVRPTLPPPPSDQGSRHG